MSEVIEGDVIVAEKAVSEHTLAYKSPMEAAMLAAAQQVFDSTADIVIDSDALYEVWGEEFQSIQASAKSLDEWRTELKAPFLNGGRDIDNKFRASISLREQAARRVSDALTKYRTEKARLARIEQARLDGLAAKERTRLAAKAADLAAKGDTEQAELVKANAEVVMAPTVTYTAPKVAGVSGRKTWKAKITDLPALLAHIAAHPECHDWVEIKQAPLDAMARTYKGKTSIPGVQAHEVETTTGHR